MNAKIDSSFVARFMPGEINEKIMEKEKTLIRTEKDRLV